MALLTDPWATPDSRAFFLVVGGGTKMVDFHELTISVCLAFFSALIVLFCQSRVLRPKLNLLYEVRLLTRWIYIPSFGDEISKIRKRDVALWLRSLL